MNSRQLRCGWAGNGFRKHSLRKGGGGEDANTQARREKEEKESVKPPAFGGRGKDSVKQRYRHSREEGVSGSRSSVSREKNRLRPRHSEKSQLESVSTGWSCKAVHPLLVTLEMFLCEGLCAGI